MFNGWLVCVLCCFIIGSTFKVKIGSTFGDFKILQNTNENIDQGQVLRNIKMRILHKLHVHKHLFMFRTPCTLLLLFYFIPKRWGNWRSRSLESSIQCFPVLMRILLHVVSDYLSHLYFISLYVMFRIWLLTMNNMTMMFPYHFKAVLLIMNMWYCRFVIIRMNF